MQNKYGRGKKLVRVFMGLLLLRELYSCCLEAVHCLASSLVPARAATALRCQVMERETYQIFQKYSYT